MERSEPPGPASGALPRIRNRRERSTRIARISTRTGARPERHRIAVDVVQRERLAEEAVMLALSGLLAVLALVEARDRRGSTIGDAQGLDPAPPPGASLSAWSARELRSLPGLGEKRAVTIVRARWAGSISGEVDSLDRVVGIGLETVARIRAELERRGGGRTVQLDGPAPEAMEANEGTEP